MRQLEYDVGKDDGSGFHQHRLLHAGEDARAPKSAHFIFQLLKRWFKAIVVRRLLFIYKND